MWRIFPCQHQIVMCSDLHPSLVYVTGNLYNQGICRFPEYFRVSTDSLNHSGNLQIPWNNQWICRYPGFGSEILYRYPEMDDMCIFPCKINAEHAQCLGLQEVACVNVSFVPLIVGYSRLGHQNVRVILMSFGSLKMSRYLCLWYLVIRRLSAST